MTGNINLIQLFIWFITDSELNKLNYILYSNYKINARN